MKRSFKVAVVLFLLVVLTSAVVFAGGGVGGHVDGGSSSSSGGSSGSSGDGDGGLIVYLIIQLLMSPLGRALLLTVAIIYVITRIIRKIASKDGHENDTPLQKKAKAFADGMDGFLSAIFSKPDDTKFKRVSYSTPVNLTLTDSTDVITDAVTEIDPQFSSFKFIAWSKEVLIQLNEAWTQKNWALIRPFEHESLYKMHETQLNEYVKRNVTNVVETVCINQAFLYKYDRDFEYENLTVAVNTSLKEYEVDDKTGKVISGNKDTVHKITYLMSFMRKVGVLTNVELSNKSTSKCPNCGAATQITSAGMCDFCQMVITTGAHDWVLTHFDSLKRDTVVDPTPVTIKKRPVAQPSEPEVKPTVREPRPDDDDIVIDLTQDSKPKQATVPCSSCGSPNEATKKFCSSCGSKL